MIPLLQSKPWAIPLSLLILGSLFWLPGLGAVHLFDWDEINFAEISREMILTGEYGRVYINFVPFWEKPPFFFWLQVLAMQVFGVNELAARLPNVACGLLSLYFIYRVGKELYDHRFGWWWVLAYFGSILPHLYFRSGIIDPVFNLFIFVGLYGLIRAYWVREGWRAESQRNGFWPYLLGGGLALGLAVLTKGPAALLIVGLALGVYWLLERERRYLSLGHFILYGLSASLLTLLWFGWETWQNGPWFVREFTRYQYRLFSTPDAGHAGFPGFHAVVLLIGCFPASVFALGVLFRRTSETEARRTDFMRWMKILFWVVLILFSIVQSKIVHYSSLCYFPLTFLAARYLYGLHRAEWNWKTRFGGGLVAIAGLFAAALLLIPLISSRIDQLLPYIQDPFARENLEAEVRWSAWSWLPALVLLVGVILFLRWRSQQLERAVPTLFLTTALFIFGTLYFFLPNIEQYSQRAVIEFWKEKSEENAYLMSFEYKSYAPLFYGRRAPGARPESRDNDWLLRGAVDKPVYLTCRVHKAQKVAQLGSFVEIGRKNGFVFFKREPQR